MAGDWIKIEHTLPDKPEVCLIAEHLNLDPDTVVGKLVRFWAWCDQQSISGNALTVTKTFLDRITHQEGFTDALLKVGWLTSRDNNGCLALSVPRFERHNGQTAKERANVNRRVAKSRKCNAATVTNVTPQPLQKPLPEKRREEKNILSSKEDSNELPFQSSDFVLFWNNWKQHRKEKKQPLTPTARKQQLENLKAMGEKRAIAALKHSMANGWLGIFEPKDDLFDANNHSKPRTFLDRNPNQSHLEPDEENPL
jgi:hypothetical protein